MNERAQEMEKETEKETEKAQRSTRDKEHAYKSP